MLMLRAVLCHAFIRLSSCHAASSLPTTTFAAPMFLNLHARCFADVLFAPVDPTAVVAATAVATPVSDTGIMVTANETPQGMNGKVDTQGL